MNAAQIDILCFSSTDWAGIWGSRQQVMQRFARRGYRVLYIEQLAGWEHLLRYPELRRRKQRRWREGMKQVEENLWILSGPPLLPGRYYAEAVNRLNMAWITRWAKKPLTKLNFVSPVLWLYKPEHAGLVGNFTERLCVYHCIDEWSAGTKGQKRRIIAQLDLELSNNADLVFANSLPTFENKRRTNPNTLRVPSGVDIALFAQALDTSLPEHPALAGLPRPRIGYIGTINERLDYNYLQTLAETQPDWSLVFAGDPYPWSMHSPPLQRLDSLSNVHFLGQLPHQEIPLLLKGIDVCLAPYIEDERGFYRSPLKLYEYLAAGRPVVGITHPEVNEFAPLVRIAANPEDFISEIAAALADDSPADRKKRAQAAAQHSWDHRVDLMEETLLIALDER